MAIFTKEVFDLENTIQPYKMVNSKKLFLCTLIETEYWIATSSIKKITKKP